MPTKTANWYKATARKRYGQKEHQLQAACINIFKYKYPKFDKLLFAIPNGAQLANGARGWKKLEREGALPGVADLFFSVPSGEFHGLYIEMKTEKGSQTKTQEEFEAAVLSAGYGYAIPRSTVEFEKTIERYLENGDYLLTD